MKLYHISQTEEEGYDTFSDAVVCASSEEEARTIHPDGSIYNDDWQYNWKTWCKSPDQVVVKYLGDAAEGIEKGVICSSFHAG